MRLFYSNNPVLRKAINSDYIYDGTVATYRGVASKLFFYIGMTLLGAFLGIYLLFSNEKLFNALLVLSLFSTGILGFIAFLFPRSAKVVGSIYCVSEGLLIGVVSLLADTLVKGTVLCAILGTIVVLMVVATLYVTNIVKVNNRFTSFVLTFAISIIISYLIIAILNVTLYKDQPVNTSLNLLVSGLTIFLITLFLFLDLENVRRIVEGGAPKIYEWYVAFGLAYTILWMYMEILPIVLRFLNDRR